MYPQLSHPLGIPPLSVQRAACDFSRLHFPYKVHQSPLETQLWVAYADDERLYRRYAEWDDLLNQLTFIMAGAMLVTSCGAAWAQDIAPAPASAAEDAVVADVYAPDYFEQFAPLTAADMVAQIPGFDIRGGGDGERGFGQASLNILINGRRPSSKSSSARDILARIPASNVTRIEIVQGETLDIPGLSGQVANIFARTGELSGSWNYAARFEKGTQPQLGDFGVNFSAKRGRLEVVGALDSGQFTFTEKGDEQFFDGAGDLIQDREEKISFNLQRPSANLNFTLNRDNDHIANLNLSAARQNRNTTVQESFEDQRDAALSGRSVANVTQDADNFEIGGDYSLPLSGLGQNGRLKLIALYGYVEDDFISVFDFDDGAPGRTKQVFDRDEARTEAIARTEYTWSSRAGHDWAASLEGALNVLDSDSALSLNAGTPALDTVRVEEDRAQVNVSRSWQASERLSLQTSLGAEYSKIAVTSTDQPSDSFFRPKGFVTASYALNETYTLRAQAERSVGQLNFGDFVSTISLAEDRETRGGNVVPEQKWEAELELARQDSTGLSGRIKAFYDLIEDPIETVLFEDGSQGPGNLDSSAQFYGVEANATWVLDDLLQGLRLDGEVLVLDSKIDDPVSGRTRAISGQTIWDYEIELRYDRPNTPYAIAAEIEQGRPGNGFRINERIENRFRRPEVEVSFIHKKLLGLQWTAKFQNVANFRYRRDRRIFETTRDSDLIQRQVTKRKRGQRFSIEVTDTF